MQYLLMESDTTYYLRSSLVALGQAARHQSFGKAEERGERAGGLL